MENFLTAYWKNLLFINYAIESSVLKPYIPAGTELDFWNNECYVSLVGFLFLDTKIRGIPIPYYRNFEECNLRFYVRFKDGNEWKRAVVFIKEIVPKRMISYIANTFYQENYCRLPMKHSLIEHNDSLEVKYEWLFKNEWNYLHAVAKKESVLPAQNSEAEFITEHYWGYTKLNDTTTSEYNVSHPKWEIHDLYSFDVHCNISHLYGEAFLPYLTQKPLSAFMAPGSAVTVNKRKVWRY